MSAPDVGGFTCESFTSPSTAPSIRIASNNIIIGDGTDTCQLTVAAPLLQLCNQAASLNLETGGLNLANGATEFDAQGNEFLATPAI